VLSVTIWSLGVQRSEPAFRTAGDRRYREAIVYKKRPQAHRLPLLLHKRLVEIDPTPAGPALEFAGRGVVDEHAIGRGEVISLGGGDAD
jgi:hypothetical protein